MSNPLKYQEEEGEEQSLQAINVIIKFVSSQKEDLLLKVSKDTKINDLKYLIYFEDFEHPIIDIQKLIIKGRIPNDNDTLESFIFHVIPLSLFFFFRTYSLLSFFRFSLFFNLK